jgi:hypothetical protein
MKNIDDFLSRVDEAEMKKLNIVFSGFVSGMMTRVFNRKKLTDKDDNKTGPNKGSGSGKPHPDWKKLIQMGYMWEKNGAYGVTKKGLKHAQELIDDGTLSNPNNIKMAY